MPLLAITAIDEIQSGIPVIGAPQLDQELPGQTLVLAATLLTAPSLLGLVFEAIVLAHTDRMGRKPVLLSALFTMGIAAGFAAMAHTPLTLALALGIWGTASGLATGVGQAALVSGPLGPDRAMARWGLSAMAGDLIGTGVVVLTFSYPSPFGREMGLDWRVAMGACALLPLLDALLLVGQELPEGEPGEDEPDEPLREAFRQAITDRPLLVWLLAATSCTLLDELVVVLVALRLDSFGVPPLLRGLEIAALAFGGVVGLTALDRWLHLTSSRAVLLASCALTAAAFMGWIAVGASPWGIALAALVGAGVGPMYPLAKAGAYARCPSRPGLVSAIDQIFAPLDLLAPIAIGFAADQYGLYTALLLLLLQPFTVALAAWIYAPR